MLVIRKGICPFFIGKIMLLMGFFLLGANWYNIYWPSFPWLTRYIQYVHAQKYKPATFAEKVAAIDFKVGKWTAPIELLKSKDFQAIYEHPTCYYQSAKDFLARPCYTYNQKKIVSYALCYLPEAFYKDWLNSCLQLYKKGRIDKVLLSIIQSYADVQSAGIKSDQYNGLYLTQPRVRSLKQVINDSLLAAIHSYREYQDRGFMPSDYPNYWVMYGPNDHCSDYSDYCAIYTHPDYYIEALVDYLVHDDKRNSGLPDNDQISKEHAIMRIKQHLSPSGYARWVSICWDCYIKGLISCIQLYSMVVCDNYMRERWQLGITHPYVIKYYKDPNMQRVLGAIQVDPRLPAAIRIELINLTSGFSKWRNRDNSEILSLSVNKSFFFHEDLHGIYIPVGR